MSYATTASRPNAPAIAVVAAIHGLIAVAFVTGLAYTVAKEADEDLKTFDVVEPAPPAEEPPAEPPASEEPTQVDVSPTPVQSRANPLSRPAAPAAPARPGTGTVAQGASLLSGSFNNETDYPSAARNRDQQGTVRVSYTVGADGRVSNCVVVQSSGSSSLDSTTCRILQRRFRYSPARDAGGNPMGTTLRQSVTWQLT